MNDVATNTLWTEPTEVEEATDAWQEYLERELGLRFHGVNSMASSTIAHRFVIDDADGSLLLRVRRDGDHKIVLECVAVGTVETTDAQIAALRDDARRVLASAAWSARNEFTPVTADLTSLVGGLTLDLITAAAVAAVFGSLNTALRKLDLSRFAGIRVAEITSRERDEL